MFVLIVGIIVAKLFVNMYLKSCVLINIYGCYQDLCVRTQICMCEIEMGTSVTPYNSCTSSQFGRALKSSVTYVVTVMAQNVSH